MKKSSSFQFDSRKSATPSTVWALLVVLLSEEGDITSLGGGEDPYLTIESREGLSQDKAAADHDQDGAVQGKKHAQQTKIVLGTPLYFAACGGMCNMLGDVDEKSSSATVEYLARELRTNIESNEAATYVIPLCRIRSASSQPKGVWMKLFDGLGSVVDRFTNNTGHFLSMAIHVRPKQKSNRIHIEVIDSKGEDLLIHMKMNDYFLQSFTDALLNADGLRQSLARVSGGGDESDARPSTMDSPRSVAPSSDGMASSEEPSQSSIEGKKPQKDSSANGVHQSTGVPPGREEGDEAAQESIETSVTYLGLQKDETSCGYWTAAILSTVVRSTNFQSVVGDFKTEVGKNFAEVVGQDSQKKQALEAKTCRVLVAKNQSQGRDVSALNAAVGDASLPTEEHRSDSEEDLDDVISITSEDSDEKEDLDQEEEGLGPKEPASKQQKP